MNFDTRDIDAPAESTADPLPAPLLELRDGPPVLTSTPADLAIAAQTLAAGTGPIAVDAERASGYRYGQRAYLLQFRREGAGTFLIDPTTCGDLAVLNCALAGQLWILHAASQDLPCLAEVGLVPQALFDTELAGRLLGLPRVGLANMVESILGFRLEKFHSADDWSTRPLPDSWLRYAALDVEVLLELQVHLAAALADAGKSSWAQQEFAWVLTTEPPAVVVDRYRRTSGLHKVRTRRGLGIVEEMWTTRDALAAAADIAPGRLLPDSAIIAAALAAPKTTAALIEVPGFRGRGVARHRARWGAALAAALARKDSDLPILNPHSSGPPPPRAWPRRNPAAAKRLDCARAGLTDLAAKNNIPVENLITPDLVRRLMWEPPTGGSQARDAFLTAGRARRWQIELVDEVLEAALAAGELQATD